MLLFPHDPSTLLLTYGNVHDIVDRHRLISCSDIKRVMSVFRPDCPSVWVDAVLQACPRTFHLERDFVWLVKHYCVDKSTCAECHRKTLELQLLLEHH